MFDKIGEAIQDAFRTLLLMIGEALFKAICFCFECFEAIGTARIIDNDIVMSIFQRIGLILSIFMIFRISFSLIQILLNPDSLTDKDKGAINIVKKVIIVIVLFGMTPTLFNYAYKIQNAIVDSNVLGKIFLSDTTASNSDIVANAGTSLSYNIFSAFYKEVNYDDLEKQLDLDEDINLYENDEGERHICPYYAVSPFDNSNINLMEYQFTNGNVNLNNAFACLNRKVSGTDKTSSNREDKSVYTINFDGIFMIAVAGVVLWIIVMYTINVGVRLFQLAFLQMIAPIPILGYLGPNKNNIFDKWWKMVLTTYLDFFIRTAIIYFVVYVSTLILNDEDMISTAFSWLSSGQQVYAKIILVMALLIFAKKVMDLIKELFPKNAASIGYGIKPDETTKRALGFGLGAGLGAVVGAFSGDVVGGLRRGAFTGAQKGGLMKNLGSVTKNQAAMNKRRNDVRAAGGSIMGGRIAGLQRHLGMETAADVDARNVQAYKDFDAQYDIFDKAVNNTAGVKNLQKELDQAVARGDSAANIHNLQTKLNIAKTNARNAILKGDKEYDYVTAAGARVSVSLTSGVDAALAGQARTAVDNMQRIANDNHNLPGFANVGTIGDGTTPGTTSVGDARTFAQAGQTQYTSTNGYRAHQANDKYGGGK